MHLYLIRLHVILLCIITSTVGFAESDSPFSAQQLINNMSRALSTLNYDGVFIYQHGQNMDTMRLIHKSDNSGNEFERLVSLTGYPREVIRDNQSVTCIFPDDKSVMVEKSRPRKLVSPLPESIETVAPNYGFSIAGQDRIAGREAWVINVIPRDKYRYGYQLWVDKDSYLLLKSNLLSKSGISLEQIMFTQLSILENIPDELLKPSLSGINYTWHENAQDGVIKQSDMSHWRVTWMPDGFSMQDYEMQMDENNASVEHLVYTDGIAMVSVFIEKLQKDLAVSIGPTRMGGVNAFARSAEGYQVTAVGEVPQETVQGMANSVVVKR